MTILNLLGFLVLLRTGLVFHKALKSALLAHPRPSPQAFHPPAAALAATHSVCAQWSTKSFSAMISACSNRSGLTAPLQIALAKGSISAKISGPFRVIAASPCRKALRLAFDLPAGVRGPRLFRPLARLATIFACELTTDRPQRVQAQTPLRRAWR